MNQEVFNAGMKIRKQVLGEAHVERSMKGASEFMMAFQEFATEWCWGAGWTRQGLSMKTRSMINLAMLTALGKPDELRLHVRGAVNNGVTKSEMQEVLLQAAIYCGIPAALESFKVADAVLAEIEAEHGEVA